MKLYRVDHYEDHTGCHVSWHASRRDAERELREAQQAGLVAGMEISQFDSVTLVDVPTDKRGLIDWLNIFLVEDNRW